MKDMHGNEITDGCVIYNSFDKNPYQQVMDINGELWFGAKGTEPDEGNDWCKLEECYATEKFWSII